MKRPSSCPRPSVSEVTNWFCPVCISPALCFLWVASTLCSWLCSLSAALPAGFSWSHRQLCSWCSPPKTFCPDLFSLTRRLRWILLTPFANSSFGCSGLPCVCPGRQLPLKVQFSLCTSDRCGGAISQVRSQDFLRLGIVLKVKLWVLGFLGIRPFLASTRTRLLWKVVFVRFCVTRIRFHSTRVLRLACWECTFSLGWLRGNPLFWRLSLKSAILCETVCFEHLLFAVHCCRTQCWGYPDAYLKTLVLCWGCSCDPWHQARFRNITETAPFGQPPCSLGTRFLFSELSLLSLKHLLLVYS